MNDQPAPTAAMPKAGQVWRSPKPRTRDRRIVMVEDHGHWTKVVIEGRGEMTLTYFRLWAKTAQAMPL